MSNRILIIGQCTLHWGRMEFGNIGNYYIVRPMFQQLRRVFPDAEIVTTMQFSDAFCKEFQIETVPMQLYYDFDSEKNLEIAQAEYSAVANGDSGFDSDYLREVRKADLVIDFSGDIWGENADFLGKDRFLTGCYKDLTAQAVTKTAMIAGSPGPFHYEMLDIAKRAYAGFDFVSNREPVSTQLLKEQGFDLSHTYNYACPSFMFEKSLDTEFETTINEELRPYAENLRIGFILCGWNFKKGPYDLWPRDDNEYNLYLELIKHIVNKYNAKIILLSHSNGFDIPPKPFVLKHGRDYPIVKQLKDILDSAGYADSVLLLDGVYTPAQTKTIVSKFDILISGRMHGAVAGLSQNIPTLILDYGHEPKAHKLRGFAEIIGDNGIITDPNNLDEMISKADSLIDNRSIVTKKLAEKNPHILQSVCAQFDELKNLME